MKKKLFIGIVSSAVFLWLAARGIDWSQFGHALSRTRWIFLIPAVVFTMLGHFSRSIRWKYMMAPVKQCGIRPLWAATAIAFMVNNLLPARLGELVRAFVIGRSQNVSRSASFATIVYERVVDVFVLILLLWFCMVRISGPEWLARSAEVLVAFNVALFALLFAMVRWRERFRLLIARVVRPLPPDTQRRMHDSADAFVVGLAVVAAAAVRAAHEPAHAIGRNRRAERRTHHVRRGKANFAAWRVGGRRLRVWRRGPDGLGRAGRQAGRPLHRPFLEEMTWLT